MDNINQNELAAYVFNELAANRVEDIQESLEKRALKYTAEYVISHSNYAAISGVSFDALVDLFISSPGCPCY